MPTYKCPVHVHITFAKRIHNYSNSFIASLSKQANRLIVFRLIHLNILFCVNKHAKASGNTVWEEERKRASY